MPRIIEKNGKFWFLCPQCKTNHSFHTGEKGWAWNGDVDYPTVSPRLKSTSIRREKVNMLGKGVVSRPIQTFCFAEIRDGNIHFDPSCAITVDGKVTPAPLAGQYLPLPDWDEQNVTVTEKIGAHKLEGGDQHGQGIQGIEGQQQGG